MCGINGIFAYGESAPPVDEAELLRTREHMIKLKRSSWPWT